MAEDSAPGPLDSKRRASIDRSAFERHAQTIVAGLALGILTWTGVTLLDVRERITRMEVRQLATPDRERYVDSELADFRRRLRDLELETARSRSKP